MTEINIETLPLYPNNKEDRIKNNIYRLDNKIVKWEGKKCRLWCAHNKRKENCKECGGSSICIHNKQKDICKECGGSRICVHNKYKSRCKDCDGSALCVHNKDKRTCKECGGSAICVHNQNKHTCKKCGGSGICVHNKRKRNCRECDGSALCVHNKDKRTCKECGGSAICVHNNYKNSCKECGGLGICKHNKNKSICRECGGSRFCMHNKHKSRCKECGGSALCVHNKRKYACRLCATNRNNFCNNCDFTSVNKSTNCYPYCQSCYYQLNPDAKKPTRFKLKESFFYELINEDFEITSYDKTLNGCSKRRPDFLFECLTHTVILEIDEDQHISYDSQCEINRLNEIFIDLADRPIVMIRFNPDKYANKNSCFKFNDKNIIIPDKDEIEERYSILKERLEYHLYNKPTELSTIEYLFFDEKNKILQ
jgi:hypothetical protein